MRRPIRSLAPALLLALMFPTAQAHVTANPSEGVAGGYLRTSFAVTHGCDGKPTIAVRIIVPEDVVMARPQPKPGWTIKITMKKLPRPEPAGHGKTVDERVAEIEWQGGRLDDAHYDEFGVSLKLPEGGDRMLWFKVTQVCEGGQIDWAQIPGSGERWSALPSPAPYIILRSPPPVASGGGHEHKH